MDESNLESIMGLIMHGGDAKGKAIEAIKAAKGRNFELAEKKLQEANQSLLLAHQSQTEQLAKEAAGQGISVSLLMVHGQDHLMNAITFIDLAKEVVDVYRELTRVEGEVNGKN
ncbi:PTS lactose/cellobiose transporter subunit IIA [Streptococcus massiliensis]|uniref:PTS system cellobiose-specific transporter subunit IIA n=1 Tax=Streptococcus massiliensis TaxID=313439 RepID=A0A380KZP8_9STRE|nr:PTS lactose/cellobiose transporter subunit IIA [Streptococcus massiliensis]SUN76416.1 PTS system cellobiose-specific transporter subunit IIA [Streptococcus massiliensis]